MHGKLKNKKLQFEKQTFVHNEKKMPHVGHMLLTYALSFRNDNLNFVVLE